MLVGRNNERFRIAEALMWSLTWAMGVALGVALGGWLTLVGGAGAPGADALDPVSDLFLLPGIVFVVVAAVQFAVRVFVAALRGRAQRGVQREPNQ